MSGQTSCSKSKLIGEWKQGTNGFSGYSYSTDIDSLKTVIDSTNKVLHTFNKSELIFSVKKNQKKLNYMFDGTRCAILYLNKRKNKVKGRPWYIVYLDENYMLMKHEVPNGDYFYYFYYKSK